MVARGLCSSGLFKVFLLCVLNHWPADDPLMSKHVATLKIQHVLAVLTVFDCYFYEISIEQISSADKPQQAIRQSISASLNSFIQGGARKTGPPSRRPTWAQVSDSVQEIKQMQLQSTYWLEKVLKMISLYVSALLFTLQHIVMQLSGV